MHKVFEQRTGQRIPAHMTVTDGEPFARRDCRDLLAIFAAQRDRFSFAILTNGTFINVTMVQQLRQLAPHRIHGTGNFAQTVSAIKPLRKQRIHTLISFI